MYLYFVEYYEPKLVLRLFDTINLILNIRFFFYSVLLNFWNLESLDSHRILTKGKKKVLNRCCRSNNSNAFDFDFFMNEFFVFKEEDHSRMKL